MTKNTMIEQDENMITNRLLLFDQNSCMSMYYRMCLLLTSHGTSLIFKERVKRKINVQRTDNRTVRVMRRCLFSTITRIITFSFGYYFNYMQYRNNFVENLSKSLLKVSQLIDSIPYPLNFRMDFLKKLLIYMKLVTRYTPQR